MFVFQRAKKKKITATESDCSQVQVDGTFAQNPRIKCQVRNRHFLAALASPWYACIQDHAGESLVVYVQRSSLRATSMSSYLFNWVASALLKRSLPHQNRIYVVEPWSSIYIFTGSHKMLVSVRRSVTDHWECSHNSLQAGQQLDVLLRV